MNFHSCLIRLTRHASAAAFGFCVASCGLYGSSQKCSDLEVGQVLRVTVREALVSPACDPVLGLVDGAELVVIVEGFGNEKSCQSAIGPVTMEGLELEYWEEASVSASGSAAFVATSRVTLDTCQGTMRLSLEGREEASGDLDTLDTMEVTFSGTDDPACPPYCNVRYAAEVVPE